MPSLVRNAARGAKLNFVTSADRSWYAPYLWGTSCGWAQGSKSLRWLEAENGNASEDSIKTLKVRILITASIRKGTCSPR